MRKSSKVLSLLLSVIMVMSVIQTALPVFAEETSEQPVYIKSTDPGATVTCTDITRVAAGLFSYAVGNVIVPATPSGIPASNGDFAEQSYAGETPTYPTITIKFEHMPDDIPQIKCTSGGTGVVLSSPSADTKNNTYSWQITSGQAEPGENIEFTISYHFEGREYSNRAYSYVEGILQAPGAFISTYYNVRTSIFSSRNKAGVNAVTRILGKGVYGSLASFGVSSENTRGYYNAGTNTFVANADEAYMVYGYTASDSHTGTNKEKTFTANGQRPYADVYIDTSTVSSLSDINLRATVNMVSKVGDNGGQTITGFMSEFGYYPAGSGSGSAVAFLGQTNMTPTNMTVGSQSMAYFTGTDYLLTDEYTILTRVYGSQSSVVDISNTAIGLRFHTVDKSALRDTISKILSGTLYEEDNPLSAFGKNKGVNPQRWYYKSGWTAYSQAMTNAMAVLNNPKVSQEDIDSARTSLLSNYDNLQLNTADYTEINALIDIAYEELDVDDWYTEDSRQTLSDAVDAVILGCNILFQGQIDAWRDAIQNALDGLTVKPADYTRLNALVEQANELAERKVDGVSIYVDFSKVAAAVASIRYDLTREDQDLLNSYADTLEAEIKNLVIRSADYTQVDVAVQTAKNLTAANYTNFTTVRTAVNAVRYNLDITQQERVDGFAEAINNAIKGLIEKPADYKELIATMDEAKALVEEHYTPASYKAVMTALAKCDGYEKYTITQQTKVNDLRVSLRNALNNLVVLDADYKLVEEAIAKWEAYTEEEKKDFSELSIQNITAAIAAVEYGLKITEQARVDEYAAQIERALNNIDYVSADYTAVNAAVSKAEALDRTYWADMTGVDNAIKAINWDLGINRQEEVDAMADAILDAINQLVPGPADYTRVLNAIDRFNALNKAHYTLDTVQAVEEVINTINWDLTKEDQTLVVIYAYDINEAILELVEADADYEELNRVRNAIPSNLSSLYTAESIKPLNDVLTDIKWNLKAKDQETVDGYVASINSAMSGLIYLPGDYAEVDEQIAIGRDRIENGVKQPDGTCYPVSKESAAAFEKFVSEINRNYNIVQTDEISAIATAVRRQYLAFTYSEAIYNASIRLEADKTTTFVGDTVEVSVILRTDYYTATTAIPVLYDANCYEIVGSSVSEAYTFSGTYADGAIKSGSITSPAKGYPSSYTAADKAQWKYAYITFSPSSELNANAVIIDPEETVVKFTLNVIGVTADENGEATGGRIWIDPAFMKTEDNLGGKLFIGRFEESVVDVNIVTVGQSIDLSGADLALDVFGGDAPANMTALINAIANKPQYEENFYTEDTYADYIAKVEAGQTIVDNKDSYLIKDQAIVNEATKAINDAFSALKLKDADTSVLVEAIKLTPDYAEEYYTTQTYKAYTDAIAAGNAILSELNLTIADNDRINAAAEAIENALTDLLFNDFSYWDELAMITIDIAPAFADDKYDADALEAYNTALDTAFAFSEKTIDIRDDAEGREIIDDFWNAYVALEKSALQNAIDSAVPEYDQSVYTDASWNAFNNAVENANELIVAESVYTDVPEIVEAVNTVNNTLSKLTIKPFSYEERIFATLDMFPEDEEHTSPESLERFWNAYDAIDTFIAEKAATWTALDDAEALALIEELEDAYNSLEPIRAEVSMLEYALALPVEDSSFYTDETWAEYSEAVEAGKALLDVSYELQDDVDAAAKAIIAAHGKLQFKPFSKLDELNAVLENVPTLEDSAYYPEYLEAYEAARSAVEDMIANADSYTMANDPEADEVIAAYTDALNALETDGVIPDADYSIVETAIANANQKLEEMKATGNALDQTTVDALTAAINAVDYTLSGLDQDKINAFAAAIDEAAAALGFESKFVFNSEDIERQNDFVLGLANINGEEDILEAIGNIGASKIVIEKAEDGYGTGTVVKLVSTVDESVIDSLTIVIIGDITGDGYVDSFDEAALTDLVNNFETPDADAVMMAADIFADGWLDAIDVAFINYLANCETI